jgi:hypothetical protein
MFLRIVQRRFAHHVAGALLLAMCAGCTSDGGTSPDPVPLGSITLSLTPASVTVAQGASGSVGLGIARGGGFAGPVTLTASGQPGAVTVAFGSSPVSAGAFSTSVTVTVPTGVAAGTYTITIRGAGVGATTQETTLTLRTT